MRDISKQCNYRYIIEGANPYMKVEIYYKDKRIASLNRCGGLSVNKDFKITIDDLGNLKIIKLEN